MTLPKDEERKYKLSSLQAKKPGLIQLLFKRSFVVGYSDFIFHLGVWGNIITGLIMEVPFLFEGLSSVYQGWGWLFSWIHGITGLLILMGGIGFVLRYFRNPFFRLAYGRVFYLDLAFLGGLALVGLVQAIEVFGFLPIASFTQSSIKWLGTLHLALIYTWIVVSLVAGGAIRHAVSTIGWRLTKANTTTGMLAFADACGKCGRCVEVCPTFEAFNRNPMEAPVVKLRYYYQVMKSRKLTPKEVRYVSEQMATCAQCNLCAGVCPYSFNYVAMYNAMLQEAQKLAPKPQVT